MPKPTEHFLTAIDVGSAKTCVLVAEITENGLRYRGHGLAESRGSRKGIIVDLDKAVASIQKAAERAEDVADIPIEHATLGVAGSHVRGINTHGGLSLAAAPLERLVATKSARLSTKRAQYPASARPRSAAPAAAGIHSRRPITACTIRWA